MIPSRITLPLNATFPTLASLLICCTISLLVASESLAQPYYGQATATVTFNGGFGGPSLSTDYSSIPDIQPGILIPYSAAPPAAYNETILGDNGNQSTAVAGLGYYFDPTIAAVTLAQGTGVSQSAPAGGNSDAILQIEFNSFFSVAPPWGPLVDFYRIPISGFVGTGGSVAVSLDVSFLEYFAPTDADPFFTDVFLYPHLTQMGFTWQNTTPGPFQTLLEDIVPTDSFPTAPSSFAAANSCLLIYGTLTFTAIDPEGPSSVVAPEGILFAPAPEPSGACLSALGFSCLALWSWLRRLEKGSKRGRDGSVENLDA